jgi:hypothetical protein
MKIPALIENLQNLTFSFAKSGYDKGSSLE